MSLKDCPESLPATRVYTTRDGGFVDENPGDKNAYRHGCVLIGDEFIFRQAFKVMLDGMISRQEKIVTHYPSGKGFHHVC